MCARYRAAGLIALFVLHFGVTGKNYEYILKKTYFIVIYSFVEADSERDWNGKWFPKKPGDLDPFLELVSIDNTVDNSWSPREMKTMGISNPDCDDAQVNINTLKNILLFNLHAFQKPSFELAHCN